MNEEHLEPGPSTPEDRALKALVEQSGTINVANTIGNVSITQVVVANVESTADRAREQTTLLLNNVMRLSRCLGDLTAGIQANGQTTVNLRKRIEEARDEFHGLRTNLALVPMQDVVRATDELHDAVEDLVAVIENEERAWFDYMNRGLPTTPDMLKMPARKHVEQLNQRTREVAELGVALQKLSRFAGLSLSAQKSRQTTFRRIETAARLFKSLGSRYELGAKMGSIPQCLDLADDIQALVGNLDDAAVAALDVDDAEKRLLLLRWFRDARGALKKVRDAEARRVDLRQRRDMPHAGKLMCEELVDVTRSAGHQAERVLQEALWL